MLLLCVYESKGDRDNYNEKNGGGFISGNYRTEMLWLLLQWRNPSDQNEDA